MASATRVLLALTLMGLTWPASALADGALYLQRFVDRPDPGVAHAQLYTYTDDGLLIHSGRGSGAHEAGQRVELPEGWYWVEVGQYRTEHNLQRLYVADDEVTVVPSGWVAVSTAPRDEQPSGCDTWNAELTAFRVDEEGREHLVASNRGTRVDDYGMLQLPVGEFVVYFNTFPVEVEVRAGEVYRLPTGYQGPVAGERPQIAPRGRNEEAGLVRSLCETGGTHVPAGDYWVSRIVPTNNYPYEERVRDRVTIPADNDAGYTAIRSERVRDRYDGEGSYPEAVDHSSPNRLTEYRRGTVFGSRTSGFEGALPGLDF